MIEQTTQSKKITAGGMLGWIFGVLFAVNGIFSFFLKPISGLVMLIMAAIILPPVTKLVDQKWNFKISNSIKIIVIFVGFIIFGLTIDNSNVSNDQQTDTQQKEQENFNKENTINETGAISTPSIDQKNTEKKNPIDEEYTNQEPTISKNEDKSELIQIEKIDNQNIPPKPSETISQQNAIKMAKSYLNYSAFSRNGLIKQLEYEKFSNADAVYGTDNSGADWYEQASKKAKAYMEYSAFSRGSLIEQLKYEGFTETQAEHGANSVGL